MEESQEMTERRRGADADGGAAANLELAGADAAGAAGAGVPAPAKRRARVESPPPPLRMAVAEPPRPRRPTHRLRRGSSPERLSDFTASPLGIALLAAWVLVLFAAFSFDVVLDVFQRQLTLRDPPVAPPALLLCTNAGFHVSLAAIVLLLGRLTRRRFRFFQPFVGGDKFVVLQLTGYGAVFLSAAARAALLGLSQERHGAYIVLGAFAALGHCLLLWSLSFFRSPPPATAGGTARSPPSLSARRARVEAARAAGSGDGLRRLAWRERLVGSPQREVAWIVLCSLIAVVSSVAAERYRAYRAMNSVVVVSFVVVSLLTIQKVVVPLWLHSRFYHVLLPVVLQSPTMYVLQLFGNGLLLLTLYGEWLLLLSPAAEEAPTSSHLGCGLMAVMAVGAHLLLVHQLHAWECEREESVAAGAQADAPAHTDGAPSLAKDPPPIVHTVSAAASAAAAASAGSEVSAAPTHAIEVGSSGPVLPSLFSVCLCVTLLGILYVTESPRYHLKAYVRQGLAQMEAMLVTLMFAQPLVTHCMGVFVYGKSYRIWQPFEGNGDYILLQCVGWCCYGLGIFFATLHLSEHSHNNFLLLLLAVLVLAQFFVHMSVVRFGRRDVQVPAPASSPRAAAAAEAAAAAAAVPLVGRQSSTPRDGGDGASDELADTTSAAVCSACTPSMQFDQDGVAGGAEMPSLLASVVSGELLLAVVLMSVSMVVRVVVVAAVYVRQVSEAGQVAVLSTAPLPVTALVGAAALLGLAATPTVQWSMRRRVRLLHPLSHAYVAVATLGWGTYLLLLSRFLVLCGVLGLDQVAAMSPTSRLGLSCFLPSASYQAGDAAGLTVATALECAVEGFVWCFPFLCLLAGNLFESQAVLRAQSIDARVRSAMTAVERLFAQQRGLGAEVSPLPDEQHQQRLSALLRAVAGSRVTDAAATTPAADDTADVLAMHDAAHYMTSVLCVATFAAFSSAAFLANAQPIMTLGFGAVGAVALALSCFSLHFIYGTRVHGGTMRVDEVTGVRQGPAYTPFMPFLGGSRFVAYQAVGWISFTCVAGLVLASAVEGKGTPVMFFMMALLSVVAQVALRRSVGVFDANFMFGRGFVQRNAEGLLAAIAVAATVSFCRLYDLAMQGRASSYVVSSLVPVAICSVSVCTAIPLGLVSLQRQAELYGLGSVVDWFTDDADDDRGDLGTGAQEHEASPLDAVEGSAASRTVSVWETSPVAAEAAHSLYSRSNTESTFSPLLGTPGVVRRRLPVAHRSFSRGRNFGAVLSFLLASTMAVLVVTVLPFAVMYMGYAYYTQPAAAAHELALHAVEVLLCCFTVLVLLPMVVVPVLGRSSTLRNVHSAFCCYALYSIPTYTVVSGVSAPFLYNCRGMWLFAINMCTMSMLSTLPYMPVAMLLFSVGAAAVFLQHHFYDCLYAGKYPFNPVHCVIDHAFAVFWLIYQRRYHGRPEVTGRLQSHAATRFFQRYFFRGLCYYFSMRVVVGDGHVLPEEEPYVADAAALPRVDLSKPGSQYIFSFHPHGVFPGTSIVVPKTELWEKAVGSSREHFVSTHCADVVLAAPLSREFPLCLGAMSVGRRGIESSLKQGNSPLIITGGQSEMLLTKMSDFEMHVVCHHLGFVRVAMKSRVPLVPVISFSESNILDNVHCIRVQRWFLKRIAFPFPVLPMGRWRLPLPTAKPVTIVIGQPISPLPGRDNPDDPACVEELRVRYFEHLEVLFYKHRAEAGYPEMELYLHNGIYNAGVRGSASRSVVVEGATRRGGAADLTVEVLESAVRKAYAAAPDDAGTRRSSATHAKAA
ncbi:Diacylglycerol acyltransferase [Novymonas esmeraldas]|uniref:Diacylglycerol acyltransferase n=1 Tax=Novymonas esmeraldas TaxID=1808958 RepID=A0AAW0EMN9_9TRYP